MAIVGTIVAELTLFGTFSYNLLAFTADQDRARSAVGYRSPGTPDEWVTFDHTGLHVDNMWYSGFVPGSVVSEHEVLFNLAEVEWAIFAKIEEIRGEEMTVLEKNLFFYMDQPTILSWYGKLINADHRELTPILLRGVRLLKLIESVERQIKEGKNVFDAPKILFELTPAEELEVRKGELHDAEFYYTIKMHRAMSDNELLAFIHKAKLNSIEYDEDYLEFDRILAIWRLGFQFWSLGRPSYTKRNVKEIVDKWISDAGLVKDNCAPEDEDESTSVFPDREELKRSYDINYTARQWAVDEYGVTIEGSVSWPCGVVDSIETMIQTWISYLRGAVNAKDSMSIEQLMQANRDGIKGQTQIAQDPRYSAFRYHTIMSDGTKLLNQLEEYIELLTTTKGDLLVAINRFFDYVLGAINSQTDRRDIELLNVQINLAVERKDAIETDPNYGLLNTTELGKFQDAKLLLDQLILMRTNISPLDATLYQLDLYMRELAANLTNDNFLMIAKEQEENIRKISESVEAVDTGRQNIKNSVLSAIAQIRTLRSLAADKYLEKTTGKSQVLNAYWPRLAAFNDDLVTDVAMLATGSAVSVGLFTTLTQITLPLSVAALLAGSVTLGYTYYTAPTKDQVIAELEAAKFYYDQELYEKTAAILVGIHPIIGGGIIRWLYFDSELEEIDQFIASLPEPMRDYDRFIRTYDSSLTTDFLLFIESLTDITAFTEGVDKLSALAFKKVKDARDWVISTVVQTGMIGAGAYLLFEAVEQDSMFIATLGVGIIAASGFASREIIKSSDKSGDSR